MRWLENEAPLTAVPHRNACFLMRTATCAPRTGLPALSFTTTVRSPLRIFSMRASAALRQAAVGSLPAIAELGERQVGHLLAGPVIRQLDAADLDGLLAQCRG